MIRLYFVLYAQTLPFFLLNVPETNLWNEVGKVSQ